MEASAPTSPNALETTVIEPMRGWPAPNLSEVWAHRDLIYFLARRDVAVRYKQAAVGLFWAVLQPLILAGVFAVFFGLLQKVDSAKGVPYPLLVVSGLVLWLAFARGTEMIASSTVSNEALISKIYFPRLVIPVAAGIPATVEFAIGLVVVVVIAMGYGFFPEPQLVLAPLAWVLAMFTALGLGLWLSALNVRYRDIGLIVPFVLLIGLFITPVTYPFDLVPDNLQALYAINPMVGVLEVFRWSVLGTPWPGLVLLIPSAMSILLVVSGAYYFRRAESTFADFI